MSEEEKENWVCSGFDLIPPEERVRGCGRGSRGGQWHFGRLYGPNLIGNYDRRIPVLVWTICRCAGVRLFGREDNYLYENDILQNSDGILYAVLRRNSEFVLLNISEACQLLGYE